MSDDAGLSGTVVEAVNDQLDVEELLGDGSLEDQLDAQAIGAAVGREFGASVGRQLGETIGREVHETVSEGIERGKDLREIGDDVKTATAGAVVTGLADLDGRDSLVSLLRSVGDEGGVGDRLADAIPSEPLEDEEGAEVSEGEDEDEDAVEAEEDEAAPEEDEEPEAEADEEPDVEAVDAGNGAGDVEVEELEELRRETLEDFLELMSYRDLQSVAKDVGVKANLSREEMTDRIVEQVSTGEAT
ncbi:hypothetical protein [Natronobeatus ordinarius]|uniref:hypothetical protein n=1 Tax=Natronobeatus ordinarius TaxID=2963433 RepID=UPI0020CF5395|nr:hypothetical protein [Natronobeatus ordinarius]